jgi:hypothetical protein
LVLSESCIQITAGPRLRPSCGCCNVPRKEDASADSISLPQAMPSSAAPTQAAQQIDPHLQGTETNVHEADPQSRGGNEWISAETWRLISHRSMLRRTGKLCQTGGRRLRRKIWDALCGDCRARTAQVDSMIEAKLAGGNIQESFCHLKGWYKAALETTTRPCPQTMVKQMAKRVDLYRQRDPPREPLPINIDPIPVDDGTLSKG